MQTLGIHHVALNVTDVEEGIRFYVDVLGGTVRTDRPELGIAGAWIDLGSQQIHLVEAPVPRNLGQHVAVRVADLDDAVRELRERGVDVADPSGVGAGRQTFINDPAGNPIELHEVATAGA